MEVAKILLLRDGKILLQHRSKDAKIDPGKWSFFGGKVEENETKEDALARELKEEIGIKVIKPDYLGAYDLYGSKIHVFVGNISPRERIRLREGQGFGLFSAEEALKLPLSVLADRVVREYFKQRQK